MNINSFINEFMLFYKDDFIYLNSDSLRFDPETNCLSGMLEAQTPGYRRNPVKDAILTNTESMFCVNQILYALLFYHYCQHAKQDLKLYAKKFLDSYLIAEMNFKYRSYIETNEPIPFTATININKSKKGYDRSLATIEIGKDKNYIVNTKGYLVDKKMHET